MDSLEQSVRTEIMQPALDAQRDSYMAEKMEAAIREDQRRTNGEVVEREPRVRPYRPISEAVEDRRLADRERARDMRAAR